MKGFVEKKIFVVFDRMRCARKMKMSMIVEPEPEGPLPPGSYCFPEGEDGPAVLRGPAADTGSAAWFPEIKAIRSQEDAVVPPSAEAALKKQRPKTALRVGSKAKAMVRKPVAASASAVKKVFKTIDAKVSSVGAGLRKMGGKAAGVGPRCGCLSSLNCFRPKALE